MQKRMKWLWCVVLILFLVSTLTMLSFSAEPTEPAALSIKCFSLSLENAAYINFKVESTGVLDPGTIKILVWDEAPEAYEKGTETLCLSSLGREGGTGYELFQYNDLAAKDMTKTVYVCAYVDQNGQEAYSAPAKFSVVMYAYLKKHAETPDDDLVALLDSMLAYGAQAQKYFDYNTEWLATDEMGEVSVVGGKLSDGFSLGWYKAGTTVTLTANEPEESYEFSHWENSGGEAVSTSGVFEAPVAEGDQTYTAVYRDLGTSRGLAFTSNNDGTCYVSGIGTCTDTDIVIPAVFPDGDRVTSIGGDAFSNCTDLTSITIPSSVTGIGNYAFEACTGLTSITIPSSVTTIGDSAFAGCTNLIQKDGGVHYVDKWVVDCDTSVTSVTIRSDTVGIGDFAFECTDLTSITIPSSVTGIGTHAFYICMGLKTVTFAADSKLTTIGGDAFSDCAGLTSITIPSSVTGIGTHAFSYCTVLKTVTFAADSKLTRIGSGAFSDCTGLTSITIPSSVTSIGESAFDGCNNLAAVYYGGTVSEWSGISMDSLNTALIDATRYYYSATQPTTDGNYWHYDQNGEITVW